MSRDAFHSIERDTNHAEEQREIAKAERAAASRAQECQSCGAPGSPLTHCFFCGEFIRLDVHLESSATASDKTPEPPAGVAVVAGPRSLGQDVNFLLELNHELVKALEACYDQLEILVPAVGMVNDERSALMKARAVLKKCSEAK